MMDELTLAQALDAYRQRYDVPGVAVATFDASGPRTAVGRGTPSVEEPTARMRPDTLFRVYSVAKSLTSTLVAQLAGDRVVDLDEPVCARFPDFRLRGDGRASEVTLRHLLSHRGGFIPDAVGHDGCGRDPDAIGEAARTEPARTPLVGAPGQVYSYSNLGFIVAGHVAERCAGAPFHELFHERVAAPLGMTRTTHDPAVAMTYPLLQHHPAGESRVGHAPWVAAKHAPSSQCWSTVEDLARLGAMHLADGRGPTGRVVAADFVRELRRPHADVRLDVDLRYGLGLYVGPRDGDQPRFGHEGFYDGMWCKLLCVPATGVGLVWADNRGEELRDARYDIIDAILGALGAGEPDWRRVDASRPAPAQPPPDGHYERPASAAGLRVESNRGRLLVSDADQRLTLEPVAADVWATVADDRARPPWRAHAGSRRVSLGAIRDAPGGEVRHVLLNGLPYRRRRGSATALPGTGPGR